MQIVRLSGPAAETPGDWRNRLLANLGKSIWSTFVHSWKITFSNWQIILAHPLKLIGEIGWWQTMDKQFGPHLYII